MASYTDLTLTLSFLSDDLDPGVSRIQKITGTYIVRQSVTVKKQLLNGLKSSSNQLQLQIARDCPSIESIIKTDGDISAVLKDGSTTIFTGFLSTNFSWTVSQNGMQALQLTLEDVGTRLLSKTFINSGYHLFNCTADAAIKAVCDAAGVTVSEDCIQIESTVTKVVDSSAKCSDILSQMLYELGYAYYFDNLGELRVFKIDCTSTDNLPVLDKDSLYVVSGKAVSLSKKIRTYKSAKVEYTSLGSADNYLVYRNTTAQDDTHEYCNLSLDGGQYFDGTEIYSEAEWSEATADSFREDALIEACNAESESELVGSNSIISVSDIKQDFASDSSKMTCSITAGGGPYLKILVHNSDLTTHSVTKLDAYASILYEKATNIVRTSDSTLTEESSDARLDETLEYVHTKALAQSHANLICQYHRYCNSQYTFYSRKSISLGSIVKLNDNMFSSLSVDVMVVSSSESDTTDIIQYTAVGISVFDFSKDVFYQSQQHGSPDVNQGEDGLSAFQVAVKNGYVGTEEEWLASLKGEDGSSYTIVIISSNGSIFRITNVNTTLYCKVLRNDQDITDTLEDSAFNWKRNSGNETEDEKWNTSSKAIGHKSVLITTEDCTGRTVFSCEVDL